MKVHKKKLVFSTAVVAVALSALLLRCSCENKSHEVQEEQMKVTSLETVSFINPVSTSFTIPFEEVNFYTGVDTVISIASGTKIFIPSCAFASSGKKEKVKLYYREVMDRAGMIATGIPMRVKEGDGDALETTGMMEIRVKKGGRDINLAEGCSIRLEMVNCMEGSDVNLYYLDENDRSWQTRKENIPAFRKGNEKKVRRKKYPEPDYEKLAEGTPYFAPVKPVVANPARFSFQFKIDLQKYPEVNVYDGILWEYAGKGGKDDPKNSPWVQTAFWKEMILDKTDKKGIYRLSLRSADKSFSTVVKPVFDQADMEYAMDVFNDRYAKYRQFVEMKKAEHQQWVKQQEELAKERERRKTVENSQSLIFRSFEIDKLGIWNCDRLLNSANPVIVSLELKLPDPEEKANRLYMIDRDNNSVLYYFTQGEKIDNFRFEKGRKYDFLVLGSQGRIYKMESLASSRISNSSGGILKVELKHKGIKVNNLDELRALI